MNNRDNPMVEKIDLDSLYRKKHEIEEHRRKIYNKILNRAHSKIKVTSRLKHDEQFCFFIVPEFILGVPKYDLAECVDYTIEKLMDNGFRVKFTEPNLLFISWQHFIPFYKREAIKKTHGVTIDGFGNVIKKKNKEEKKGGISSRNTIMGFGRNYTSNVKKQKSFKSTDGYKSSGLIYDDNILRNLDNSFKN